MFCFFSSNLKLIKTPGWAKKGRLLTVVQGSPALRLKHVVPKIPAITTVGWCHKDQFGRRSTCTKCMLKPLFTVEKTFRLVRGSLSQKRLIFNPYKWCQSWELSDRDTKSGSQIEDFCENFIVSPFLGKSLPAGVQEKRQNLGDR